MKIKTTEDLRSAVFLLCLVIFASAGTLAQDNDAEQFQETFKTIGNSIKLTDGR